MNDREYKHIRHGTQAFRWRWDKALYVSLDCVEARNQRLVCLAWPENDEQYPDRQSFLRAVAEMMTDSFVADSIQAALTNGWSPSEPGPDFVVQFDNGAFTIVGQEPR